MEISLPNDFISLLVKFLLCMDRIYGECVTKKMQNVVRNVNSNCDGEGDSHEVGKVYSVPCSLSPANFGLEPEQSLSSLQSNFMGDISESDDEEVSEVESFILDQAEFEEEQRVLDTSKFLLSAEGSTSPDLRTVDPETQARLEAILEATGISKLSLNDAKQFNDPEVLRRLTSSVSCALDEAAAALTRMRTDHPVFIGHDDSDGRSLAEACSDGDIGTVRRLLDEGRNVNEITEEGESLLSLACSSGYFELAQLLLAMSANVEDRGLKDTTPLMEAASSGHVDIVRLLISHGADVNAQTSQGPSKSNMQKQVDADEVCLPGNTPLMYACAGGHEEVVKVLLEAGANVEDHNENGHTPLMEAASAGHVGVARILVEHGASINTHSNEFKESALTLACYKGHLEMVRFLLEAGADQEHKTDEMHTALMEASMDGHVEVARLLLDSGAQVNMPADSFESPLTLAACGGHVDLALLLLERGANIEEVNDEGYSPLMEAAREGHEEMVSLLLSHGADINAQTEETQETALTLACCGGFIEVADLLIRSGADIELGASTPLMEAAQEGHLDLVRFLVKAGANVNAHTATRDTALTYACENGHTDVADLLLQAGAQLEHESEGGRTPLMKAARAGHLCTVQFLISKGANVNKQTTNNDHTPLSLACAGGHLNVVELLLAHGADPTHRLKDNSTMLIEAAKGGHTTVVQLLLDYPNLAPSLSTAEFSQIAAPALETVEAPRVPPHGLQLISQDIEQNLSGEQQNLTAQMGLSVFPATAKEQESQQRREAPPSAGSQQSYKQKSVQRKNVQNKSQEVPTSSSESSATALALQQQSRNQQQQGQFRSKTNAAAQTSSASIDADSAATAEENAAAVAAAENNPVEALIIPPGQLCGNLVTSTNSDLRPSERLEACINSMMKKAELLHPSKEEQILQKQQILEELQRVERELQEKAHAQLLLTAQQQQQQHLLQAQPTLTSQSSTIATLATGITLPVDTSGISHQLLLNNTTVLDVSTLSSQFVPEIAGQLGLSLKATTAAAHLVTAGSLPPLLGQTLYQQPILQPQPVNVVTTSSSEQQQQLLQQQQQQQPTTKTRATKQCNKQLRASAKQQQAAMAQQQPQQTACKIQTQLEDVEKMNMRNVLYSEQLQQQQQLLAQQQQTALQQQYALSDYARSFALGRTDAVMDNTANALTLLQVAGGVKLATEGGTLTHSLPVIDPVVVSQALALQQQQQQLQQQQLQQQQLLAANQDAKKHHLEKCQKLQKGKKSAAMPVPQHQNVQLYQSLQNQQTVKPHFVSPVSDACTLVSNIPLDAASVLTVSGVGGSTFPVSLSVSPGVPLGSPASIANTCGSTITHSLTLEDGLMVAAPARTLHETLGEIMTGPTTQLAGSPQVTITQQVSSPHCLDPCLSIASPVSSVGGVELGLTVASIPTIATTATSLPLTFHALSPVVTSSSAAVAAAAPSGIPALSQAQTVVAHQHQVPPSSSTQYPQQQVDLDSQTDSNHDTALTLACAGGHEELVSLLLTRGADIEHRDKKGFTPLMLAATAGHAGVVEILLHQGADIEAQSERTKDTALSLACSGGRYEVVEILLGRGANKEHRNVSDYTPLSLAASGGYVNIIKLLLNHGAEINSRTGSKLGISPLMLAAMNGHTAAVKVLLDMGSDINAQIETNRNTALTLACFQGRHEVVSLLLDRRANVEHRAKTGLTPLMEAASGGYVEVGRVLLDKGADVNAPPVPSSRDSALTIAADKGHYRFVELLLSRGAAVDVKNKKGNSPLWLAANGGHLDVVQLLVSAGADIDSQDNRKVSCLMAAFRKGHVKVVKWMVKHVTQFPSDQEMTRYLATITDKELLKKCHQCMEIIRAAKERQAAEANKFATILLEEIDMERSREESRRAAAARRRERKRRKKKEKQEQLRAAKAAAEENKRNELKGSSEAQSSNRSQSRHLNERLFGEIDDDCDGDDDFDDDDDDEDDEDEEVEEDQASKSCAIVRKIFKGTETNCSPSSLEASEIPSTSSCSGESSMIYTSSGNSLVTGKTENPFKWDVEANAKQDNGKKPRSKRHERTKYKKTVTKKIPVTTTPPQRKYTSTSNCLEKNAASSNSMPPLQTPPETYADNSLNSSTSAKTPKKLKSKNEQLPNVSSSGLTAGTTTIATTIADSFTSCTTSITSNCTSSSPSMPGSSENATPEPEENIEDRRDSGVKEFRAQKSSSRKQGAPASESRSRGSGGGGSRCDTVILNDLTVEPPHEIGYTGTSFKSPGSGSKVFSTQGSSPKKGQKREDGWKEVVRRSKKVLVPANSVSRVIGRGGCNINAIRELSGAHIEVEKQKGPGDRTVNIRGSTESTRQAHQLISALIKDPDVELAEITSKLGISKTRNSKEEGASEPAKSSTNVTIASTTSFQITSSLASKGTVRPSLKAGGAFPNASPYMTTIPPSLPASATPPFTSQHRSATFSSNIRPSIPINTTGAFGIPWTANRTPSNGLPSQNSTTCDTTNSSLPVNQSQAAFASSGKPNNHAQASATTTTTVTTVSLTLPDENISPCMNTKTTVSYTMAVIARGKTTKTVPSNPVPVVTRVMSSTDTKSFGSSLPSSSSKAMTSSSPLIISLSTSDGIQTTAASCHFVKPFPDTQYQNVAKSHMEASVTQAPPLSASSVNTRGGTGAPPLRQPFTHVSSSPSTSSNSPSVDADRNHPNHSHTSRSALTQEYSPFNNLFSKVAQPSVWTAQREREMLKPNFASVAASGVTLSGVHPQNMGSGDRSAATAVSLALPSELELMVDASKAPGYRGNIHVSPSASHPDSASTASNYGPCSGSQYGPIGSGPRSAPCTPPLTPVGQGQASNSATLSNSSPAPSSPSPMQARSLPETHAYSLKEMSQMKTANDSNPNVASANEHQMGAATRSEPYVFPHQPPNPSVLANCSTSISIRSYTAAATPSSRYYQNEDCTTTTYCQPGPLLSVNMTPSEEEAKEESSNRDVSVIQSNLNPNAPDFSSRSSIFITQAHPLPPHFPAGPMPFQDHQAASAGVISSFRTLPTNSSLSSHFTSLPIVPTLPQHGMNQFSFGSSGHHHQHVEFGTNHQVGHNVPGMHQSAADPMRLFGAVGGYSVPSQTAPPMHHHVLSGGGGLPYYMMPSGMGMRVSQRSSNSTPSLGTSTKDDMSPSASPHNSHLSSPTGIPTNDCTIPEDRKLPRPIGTERAQRKTPAVGSAPDMTGQWPINHSDLYGNRKFMEAAAAVSLPLDRYQQLYSTATSTSAYPPFVNGVPPHLMNPQVYPPTGGIPAPVNSVNMEAEGGSSDMWGGLSKAPPPPSPSQPPQNLSNGLPHLLESMLGWYSRGQHPT